MTKKISIAIFIVFIIFCGTIVTKLFNKNALSRGKETPMKITTVFSNQEKIPTKYTCDGEDISPELFFTDIPATAESLVLIVDDPDAPMGNFTHWLLYNIPAGTERVSSQKLPNGSVQGVNDFGRLNYGGPCPPSGVHRYFFKLYALDNFLELKEGATKKELQNAIKTHIIEDAELIGLYSRK